MVLNVLKQVSLFHKYKKQTHTLTFNKLYSVLINNKKIQIKTNTQVSSLRMNSKDFYLLQQQKTIQKQKGSVEVGKTAAAARAANYPTTDTRRSASTGQSPTATYLTIRNPIMVRALITAELLMGCGNKSLQSEINCPTFYFCFEVKDIAFYVIYIYIYYFQGSVP